MKSNVPFNDFSSGQLSSSINGKINLSIYRNGVQIMQNIYTNVMGNAIYRHGFRYDSATKNNKEVWFREFKFSITQSYLIIFSEGVFRFLTYDSGGDLVYVESAPGVPYEVAHPYALADLKDVKTAQNGDVMYFVHPSYEPRKLTRTGASTFTFTTFTRTSDPFGGTNWPRSVAFYEARLFYGGSTDEPTTIFGSKAGSPDDFTLTPVADDMGVEYIIAEFSEPIEWLFSGANALIAGSAEGLATISGGSTNAAITPTNVYAKKVIDEGASNTTPIRKDGKIIYLQNNKKKARSFSYDIIGESYEAKDLNLINYDITNNRINELIYKKDRFDIIYSVREDGKLLGFINNIYEERNGWFPFTTDGEFISIGGLTNPEGDTELFACIKRTIGGVAKYYIEQYTPYVDFTSFDEYFTGENNYDDDFARFKRVLFEKMKDYNYLDSSIKQIDLRTNEMTFDGTDTIETIGVDSFVSGDVGKYIKYKAITGEEYGTFEITAYVGAREVTVKLLTDSVSSLTNSNWYLTFNSVTGLSHLEGKEVLVLADGGYLESKTVASGNISLSRQVTVAYVGLQYIGILKTFNLGFLVGATNTQQTKKNIYKVGVRFNYSAGVQVGTDLYHLEDVQQFDPTGNFDEPPLLMHGDKEVKYKDDATKEKYLYIVQNYPLPMSAVMMTAFINQSSYT